MADVVETLTTFNKTLTAVNAIMSPGGALSLAISGIRAAIENRRKKGEQVKDLLVEVEALEQALFCRDLAGTCVLIGVPGPGPTLTLDLQRFFDTGGHLCVSWYGDCLPTRDFPLLAEWYRQGQLKLDQVVSRTISLDETDEAFAAMERGETLRSVIAF